MEEGKDRFGEDPRNLCSWISSRPDSVEGEGKEEKGEGKREKGQKPNCMREHSNSHSRRNETKR